MRTFAAIADAREAITDFRAEHFDTLDEDDRTLFRQHAASPSPVVAIVDVMELLYARRATLTPPGVELMGGLAAFATVNAWHGLLDDSRGDRIVQAARRMLGERPPAGLEWPDPDSDPAVAPRYAADAA